MASGEAAIRASDRAFGFPSRKSELEVEAEARSDDGQLVRNADVLQQKLGVLQRKEQIAAQARAHQAPLREGRTEARARSEPRTMLLVVDRRAEPARVEVARLELGAGGEVK